MQVKRPASSGAEWYQNPLGATPRGVDLEEYSAYLRRFGRADERTRTADLLITSDHSGIAGGCPGLQIPHR
jgi:hypothetical protein